MPHIVIEYSPDEGNDFSEEHLMDVAHQTSMASELFAEADIKVRVQPYSAALVAGKKGRFLHAIIYLIEGRDAATKKALTTAMHDAFRGLAPNYESISVDARDLARDIYVKSML